jgi:Amidohydrolase family
MTSPDIVLYGGRVIDPETGRDEIADVAISAGRITEIGHAIETAALDLDVTGQVVTAGFIDLHSHTADIPGLRLRALDGVTTALELEAGVSPVAAAYRQAAAEGRPVNYGFAASWALARMEAVAGIELDGRLGTFLTHIAAPAWQGPASPAQVSAILSRLSADLADGAIGIGLLVGYAPGADPGEYLEVAALAAEAGVATFTHARDLIELAPDALIDGALEIIRAAGETGAQMHYCHINSTSLRHIDRVQDLVSRAQAAGSRVSTEAYPYGSGMTGIGAAFLAPERLHERDLRPTDLTYAPTGEQVANEDRLRELRAADPGGLAIIRHLNEDDPADLAVLMRSLTFPEAIVASDAMPLTWSGPVPDPMTWPLPATVFTHPRTAGTFSRALRMLAADAGGPVGSGGPLGLTETLRRSSLLPAQLLAARVPAMRRKGRVQTGCDADLLVFDPATVTDRATYSRPTRPSAGISHVLVNGTFVVRDAGIVPAALPGQPIRATPR